MKKTLIAFLFVSTLSAPTLADTLPIYDHGPIVSVKGEGKVEVKPEFAELSATISVTKPTIADAAAALPARSAQALELFKSLEADGLEIRQSNYSLSATRAAQVSRGLPQADGNYLAAMRYNLRISRLDDLSGVISKINAAGLFETSGISFGVADEHAARNLARKAAYLDALEQAKVYADAANVRLDQVIAIVDGDADTGMQGDPDMMRSPSQNITIIPPARLTYIAGVNVTWRIAPRS